MRYFFFVFILFLFVYSGCGGSGTNPPQGGDTLSNKFSDIQKTTFNTSCSTNSASCHGDSTAKSGLDLQAGVAYYQLMHHVISENVSGTKYKRLVVPGFSDSSFLIEKLTDPNLSATNPMGTRMPQGLPPLPHN